ncbi:30S ribosomal protein S3 [Candidatus Woesearchaeota archaeon]|nr:30S ribosomal protein S3 [Candidatus Woesearchaeota archaeon]|tara:strand:+ start:5813 stop:6598 length:786 start_codon:yes stop_codon:yes gene_type:complete
MIERKFVAQKTKEFLVQEYIEENLKRVGHSHTKIVKTPLGVKVIIYASRPGLIVGKKGQNIKKLTNAIKKKFDLENPQIEINEVENIGLDAQIIAEMIANSLERYGTSKFKGIGHKTMANVLEAGALGVEILISGKIPSSRAKRWRFYQGYLKKSGDISQEGIKKATTSAQLKSGTVGIQVKIMPPDIQLPDEVKLKEEITEEEEGSEEEKEKKEDAKESGEEKPEKETKKETKEKTEKKAKSKETKKETKQDKKNGNAKK